MGKLLLAGTVLAAIGILNPLAAQAPGKVRVHVQITGLRNAKGEVGCALYSSADGFPKDEKKAVAHMRVPIQGSEAGSEAVCNFDDVSPGRYAVSVYHDENGNGKMDTNFIGMPREGVGASNNAKGHMGPPKFSDAAFTVGATEVDQKIVMFYL